jgi:hypothetical protein
MPFVESPLPVLNTASDLTATRTSGKNPGIYGDNGAFFDDVGTLNETGTPFAFS